MCSQGLALEIGSVAIDFDSNLPRVLFDFDFGFALIMYDVLKSSNYIFGDDGGGKGSDSSGG